ASTDNRIISNAGYADDCFIDIRTEDIVFINNSIMCGIKFSRPIQYINESNFQGNTIHGSPIVFRSNQTGVSIPFDAVQIFLFSCRNMVIEERVLGSGTISMHIFYSTNITIRRNHFEIFPHIGIPTGIRLVSCQSCTLTENSYIFTGDFREGIGIELLRCNNCVINNSEFRNLEWGILLNESLGLVILENEFYNNEWGLAAAYCNAIKITNNWCEANQVGITCVYGAENSISENTCYKNNEGITFHYARGSRIFKNNCNQHFVYSIFLQGGSRNYIQENYCYYSPEGIHLQAEKETTIILNTLSRNGYGVYLDDESSFNQVLLNDFMDNLLAHAWNDGRDNVFDGNYWPDYVGWDLNFDGYGELPYIIPGQIEARDYRPRGDTLLLSLQLWVGLLFVCSFLIATVILGRHLWILAKGEDA
ncbi:MAG: NosD domain-containing protein, partial [Candidatus Hermodarchaeota archaeon]|nr:NosD domain-containing protein [Candidatus Hermodarchaeota archaeon]